MKNIRLLLGLLITFVLFGCTSLQDKELSSQKEVIHSFFIAEDNIYAIGQLNSYHFAGSEYSETGDLIRILRSPYVKNISSVKIHSIAKDVEKNKVKATLTLYFNDKELTQKLIATELEGREYLMAELDKAGYEYVFQGGNYVTIKAKTDAETVAERLLTEKKISIKTSGYDILKGYIRVTTGDVKYMKLFVEHLLELDK